MWKFYTNCRENEAGLILRGCLLLICALVISSCVAGPTPHPAESEASLDEGGAGGPRPSEQGSSDAFSEPSVSDAATSAGGPDVDQAGEVSPPSDADVDAADTGDTVSGDTVTTDVKLGDTVTRSSDAQGDTASDTASDSSPRQPEPDGLP